MTNFSNNSYLNSPYNALQRQQLLYNNYKSYDLPSTQRMGGGGVTSENTLIQQPEEKKTGWGTYLGIGMGFLALGSVAYMFRKQIGESVSELGKGFQKSEKPQAPVVPSKSTIPTPTEVPKPKVTVEPFKIPKIDVSLHNPVREVDLIQEFDPHTYDKASLPRVFVETRTYEVDYNYNQADSNTGRLFRVSDKQMPKLPKEVSNLGRSGQGLGVTKDQQTGNLVVHIVQDSSRTDSFGRRISHMISLVGDSDTKLSPAQRDAIEAYANSADEGTHFDEAFYKIKDETAKSYNYKPYNEELGFDGQHFFNEVQAWYKKIAKNKPDGYITADEVLKQVEEKGTFIKHNKN
jgi:hypothetical protein